MEEFEIERCVLVKPEVFMYRIPPRQSARGYRAADWNLSSPDWTGRLRCMVRGSLMTLRLEDRGSNELFAACPVEQFPGMSVEPVTDSSRYFVICIKDDTGRKAFIGIGFADRSDSFDLNVALQDHFKQVKKEETLMKEGLGTAGAGDDPFGNAAPPKPSLDLAFKEGQTIRVNLNIDRKRDKPAARTGGINLGASPLLLPPPPGASSVSAIRPASNSVISPINAAPTSNFDLLGGFDSAPASTGGAPSLTPVDNGDPWGDFTSAPSTMKSGSWEQF